MCRRNNFRVEKKGAASAEVPPYRHRKIRRPRLQNKKKFCDQGKSRAASLERRIFTASQIFSPIKSGTVNPIPTVIRLEKAVVRQQGRAVLEQVDLSVFEGEMVYLVGKTGSGKSSLLKTLYGDLPLLEGSGSVAGFDLRSLKPAEVPFLRRKLGIVFQDFNLLGDRTAGENLLFVLRATGWEDREKMRARAMELLDRVGLAEAFDRFPHELSGGEQQRVVIARALLNEPKIILADEPTGHLDPDTSDEVLRLLRKLSEEDHVAVLMATHDYLTLEKFPARIVRCQDGKVGDEQTYGI